MISPSDVSSERDAVTEILAKWNAQIGTALGARIELVKWESHSTPDLSGPPQEVLNKQLLPDCDFAVAIFWSRLGTPTENYESGSVEEIDKLLQKGKRVLIYFNTSPIPQDMLDDDQFERLQKVKKRFLKQGLLSTYESTEELKIDIQNHLTSVVNSLPSKDGRSTRGSSLTDLAENPGDLKMPDKIIKRLPEAKTLYDILQKGTEGGREFARIVDLLLFHEARRAGKTISISGDVTVDYRGLDSFEGDIFRREGTVGYQYKFYPSPLSSKHRDIVVKSLKRAADNQEHLKLTKWILVTPEDLMEPATRKDGGDVTWFEDLRSKLDLEFELEHWGHTKLLFLFLETPALCLYYYPEFIPDGAGRKKTIQDTYNRYNDNVRTLYRNIEFVGMSVYKPEAAKGIPMEHIYIPLKVIPEAADEMSNIPGINPLSLLMSGNHCVILGDPGSGKSILLRFLTLIGNSKQLQSRYKSKPDKRLPILVTLRQYADELKSRANLSLIDYIMENIQGTFNLKSADLDFFEYHLETGQTILLFDGLDELPNPQFKKTVRDRIRTLTTTYPGNTTIVTSRIVGYDNPFRFDDEEFGHYRLAKLQLPEIEQFVKDWYTVRIENKSERETNVDDLIRILKDDDYIAIRELAENPLLLTIITLVHRIDAVLPDERIILYQKCTETLLNTWHTWKFRAEEVKRKGKVERRNRQRMEAIAHWMHNQGGGAGKTQRAIVPYNDLRSFLTRHIVEIEKLHDSEYDAEDLADEFLEFVKRRAGLLIEVGDNRYSFIHLTFQEYLTSAHIITSSEKYGVEKIWQTINEHCDDPRWHEVIRLLIAGLKSNDSQEFLIEKIIDECETDLHITRPLLLGGLLLDGIESAEDYGKEILKHLLHSGTLATDTKQLRPVSSMLRTWLIKDDLNEEVVGLAFQSLWGATTDAEQKISLTLIAFAMDWSETKIIELTGESIIGEGHDADLSKLFLSEKMLDFKESLTQDIELFWLVQDVLSLRSPYGNFAAAAGQAITSSLGTDVTAKRVFEEQMVALSGMVEGPFLHFTFNGLQITPDDQSPIYSWARDRARDLDRDLNLNLVLDRALSRARDLDLDRARALSRARALDLNLNLDRALDRSLDLNLDRDLDRARALGRARVLGRRGAGEFWQAVLAAPDLYAPIIDILCDTFALTPRVQWWEALRVRFLPMVPQRITMFDRAVWKQVETAVEDGNAGETEVYSAAWQLLFDSWLYIFEYYKSSDESIFSHLADLTREMDDPPLRIAHCIRDLAYGDESRIDDLIAMVGSDDPVYRAIFETCLWRPTPDEGAKEGHKRGDRNDNEENKIRSYDALKDTTSNLSSYSVSR